MKCKWCSNKSTIKQGHIWLCDKHYRFQQMRVNAKRHNKVVPSYEELEILDNKICPSCKRRMNWRGRDGQSTVITLQHDKSGRILFLCRACNTIHAKTPENIFYNLPKHSKYCHRCKVVKNINDFYKDRRIIKDG